MLEDCIQLESYSYLSCDKMVTTSKMKLELLLYLKTFSLVSVHYKYRIILQYREWLNYQTAGARIELLLDSASVNKTLGCII